MANVLIVAALLAAILIPSAVWLLSSIDGAAFKPERPENQRSPRFSAGRKESK